MVAQGRNSFATICFEMAVFFAVSYFPASGYRTDSGALTGVSTDGYSWASTPLGIGSVNGVTLYFLRSDVHPFSYGRRYISRPVRCVQAFTKVS